VKVIRASLLLFDANYLLHYSASALHDAGGVVRAGIMYRYN
jgi:hypothetical protein